MSLRLTYRKSRAKGKRKTRPGTYYIEGTDHRGQRVHESLKTGDRSLAKSEFAKFVAATTQERLHGAKGVCNFADAVQVYLGPEDNPRKENNSNVPYLEEMISRIGTVKLCDITQATLDKLAKDMRGGRSPATRKRHVYSPFIAVWNAAAEHEPPLCDYKKWKSPKVPKRRGDCPDDGYIATLVHSIDLRSRAGRRNNVVVGSRKPERDKAVVLFITLTGARSGEAQKLTLRDLFLDRAYAVLRVKGNKMRQVALTPELVEALRAQVAKLHEAHGGEAPPETLVFECATRWGIPQIMRRTQKRAHLPRYRPHQIGRHAFATRLLNAGENTMTVRDAGGWDSTRMIDQFYGHLAKSRTDGVVASQSLTPNKHPAPKKTQES